ncbi:von Willebrand factor [Trichonephila clavipes]|uniref:von Willebrand factor n=1 Tax=Trichonephila clavipes TaxID=2585209 RepID=A0A8X6SRJ1_TRICX|nr:von Willebrand factor [Trichonephila clavipes]
MRRLCIPQVAYGTTVNHIFSESTDQREKEKNISAFVWANQLRSTYPCDPRTALLHPHTCSSVRIVVQNTPGIHFVRGPSVSSSHFESPHLYPQNDVPSISFLAMETDKNSLMLESIPYTFFSNLSVSGDFSSKTQNLMFPRCSKDGIAKSDE